MYETSSHSAVLQNGHASFYVGVRHPQSQYQLLAATESRLQRVSTHAREHEAQELDEDDSDDSWQPETPSSRSATLLTSCTFKFSLRPL